MTYFNKQFSPEQKQGKKLQERSAGDEAKTIPPYDPLGTNTEFATEIADGKKPNSQFTIEPPPYVGRGGMKVDKGDPPNNS